MSETIDAATPMASSTQPLHGDIEDGNSLCHAGSAQLKNSRTARAQSECRNAAQALTRTNGPDQGLMLTNGEVSQIPNNGEGTKKNKPRDHKAMTSKPESSSSSSSPSSAHHRLGSTMQTLTSEIEESHVGDNTDGGANNDATVETKAINFSCFPQQRDIIRKQQHILILPIFIFVILCGSAVSIIELYGRSNEASVRKEASLLAIETAGWFSDQLDQALLPLFSLAQFVNELEVFHDLPDQIGPANLNGSLPFVPPIPPETVPTHRNVSGVCDQPDLVQRFTEIASTIKRNSGMEGVLVNLQLVPNAVVCLLHPVNNTDDFPPGVYLDNSGAIGHDLLMDPARSFIAEATVPRDDVVIAGPLTLRQCPECDATVRSAFIARLPITMEGKEITVGGVSYPRWGFAVALINWEALVDKSGIYDTFDQHGFEFQLTRTDRRKTGGHDDDSYTEKNVVLAETDEFERTRGHRYWRCVPQAVDTTNNEWVITVCYSVASNSRWRLTAIVMCVVVSLAFSALLYTTLMQKQIHTEAMSAKSALMVQHERQNAKAERELNDFIAHEIRNPLSAAMAACSFVSTSVSERQALKDADAMEAVREDVGVIDTSLHFVNDLLRDMLDMHRAVNKQMKIENTATDIRMDILEPVACMLYRRNDNFEAIVECPENLVVMTDRVRLKQVVLNLGRNAAKFVERGFVRLRAVVEDDHVCIYVEDSGPGIPEEKRGKLFNKFQESLDSLSQGTGVGLSLCEKIVTMMGGVIYLDESFHSGVVGCPGARFVIDLQKTEPISMSSINLQQHDEVSPDAHADGLFGHADGAGHKGQMEEAHNATNTDTSLPDNLSILFVDDDLILRKLFCRSVKKCMPEWKVKEASNGETALMMVDDNHFDIIFLDQYMTSVDKQLLGTETARALRAKGVRSRICGLSANDLGVTFLESGADAFMLKPFPCQKEKLTTELLRVWASASTNGDDVDADV